MLYGEVDSKTCLGERSLFENHTVQSFNCWSGKGLLVLVITYLEQVYPQKWTWGSLFWLWLFSYISGPEIVGALILKTHFEL